MLESLWCDEMEGGLKTIRSSLRRQKQHIVVTMVVKKEYEDIVQSEVQRANSADEEAMARFAQTTSIT